MQTTITRTEAAAALKAGKIGVMPTDTIYGIVARLDDAHAVARLHQVKRREHKPAPVIAASIEQLQALGLDSALLARVSHVWPGPVSVVLPAPEHLAYAHFGLGLAVRIPADPALRNIVGQTGPLVASSANITGQPVATTSTEAYRYFGDAADFYVDGGTIAHRPASTIVRPAGDRFEILRQGAAIVPPDLPRHA